MIISNKFPLFLMAFFGGVHSRNVIDISQKNTIGMEEKE